MKMKKRWVYLLISVLSIFVLTSCGSNKYNEAVDNAFKYGKENLYGKKEKAQMKRENSEVWVFDKGKYIEIDFPSKDVDNKPFTWKEYYALNSKGEYESADSDTKNYIKEDAKLVYHEKNGKHVKE